MPRNKRREKFIAWREKGANGLFYLTLIVKMYLNWNSVLGIFQNYICAPLLPENFLKVKPQQLIGGIPLCLSDLLEFASRICLIRCVWNDPSALILLPMTLWNLNISLLDLSFQFDSDNLNLFWRLFCWMGWLLCPTLYRPRNVLQLEKVELRKCYQYRKNLPKCFNSCMIFFQNCTFWKLFPQSWIQRRKLSKPGSTHSELTNILRSTFYSQENTNV